MSDSAQVERLKMRQLRMRQKAERQARQDAQLDKLIDALTSPAVVRTALVAGIIAYSTWATRSDKNVGPIASALALAGPGIGIPIIAADAGITDWKALAAISAAGTAYAGLSMVQGWSDAGVFNLGKGNMPAWAELGLNALAPGAGSMLDLVT